MRRVRAFVNQNKWCLSSTGASGKCYTAASRLSLGLGVPMVKIEWETGNHFAVLINGSVVDVTARQFDPLLPCPLVVAPEDWATTLGLTDVGKVDYRHLP